MKEEPQSNNANINVLGLGFHASVAQRHRSVWLAMHTANDYTHMRSNHGVQLATACRVFWLLYCSTLTRKSVEV